MVTEQDIAKIANKAMKACWTPCNHYTQCMGVCPMCLIRWVLENKDKLE